MKLREDWHQEDFNGTFLGLRMKAEPCGNYLLYADDDAVPVSMTGCHLVGPMTTVHIRATASGVAIKDLLIICGRELRWETVFQLKMRPLWYAWKRVSRLLKGASA